MAESVIVIENLAAFRADIRRAIGGLPRNLTLALKAAGVPAVEFAGEHAPQGPTGNLRAGYGTQVRGVTGSITSKVPYGAGAEWGRFGKWKGFNQYGAPGERFAGRGVDEKADEILDLVTIGLAEVMQIYGWAT